MEVLAGPDKEIITIRYASSDAKNMSTEHTTLEVSPQSDLPPFCYDGSHLPWKAFRQHVLGAHRIRILDSPPREKIPQTLVAMIEADMPNATRYGDLERAFREQVGMGRGFGPSPIFPPNILPPIDDEPRLARCMIPCFSRDALPERALNRMGPFYELQVPRSGLGCGFSSSSLSAEEISVLPPWLVTTGTIVHFDTGYISPGAALYCPFLIFERAFGEKEQQQRLEAAKNQSAVGGACCVRALQMLYARAWKGQRMPALPVAFSCVIDNTFAVLNIHWIDHGQAYCMSPLCKFDLSREEHFKSFLVWVDAVGKWALAHLLPVVKTALGRLRSTGDTPPPTPRAGKLTLDTGGNGCAITNAATAATVTSNDVLIRSLKTTFDHIPWRFEDDEFTPVSSSTASWGSPMITDVGFANMGYPLIPRTPTLSERTPTSASSLNSSSFSALQQRRQYPSLAKRLGQSQSQCQDQGSPPPAYTQNPELVWQKRFSHAMDEVRDLQRQLTALKNDALDEMRDLQRQLQLLEMDVHGSTVSVHSELSGIKTTINSLLRKETFSLRNKSLTIGIQESWSMQNSNSIPKSPLVNEVRPLKKAPTISTEKVLPTYTNEKSAPVSTPSSPKFLSPGLPSPGLPSPGMPSPTFSIQSEMNIDYTVFIPPAPPKSASLWRFASMMVSGHVVGMFIPNMLLRVFVLGCVTDVCMLAFVSPHYPSSAEYFLSLWRTR
ncbi:hypothetical protein A1O1_02488 [Capronia coronata CBS 617.96]|uniref:DUF7924 domain-containing protein n=1 Tax=Capronia coronata CBS 617.96 TaxID=1182541 RepID=W9YWN6_9EURO|nr:uncharacterized protein A1O1_02488 [Capronia coronata CBS 617.96]EXJ94095.1 hypothetical protein A1O1_02488 [Capronia coronata CBS 617.96]